MIIITRIWDYIVNFCNNNVNIFTVISVVFAILGFFEVKTILHIFKERIRFNRMFVAPTRDRPTAERMNAYIDATYNGASEVEVSDNV